MNDQDQEDTNMVEHTEEQRKDILFNRIGTEARGEECTKFAEQEISRICRELDIPEGVETVAGAVYRRAIRNEVIQNVNMAELTAAAVYAACRVDNCTYSLKEISKVSPAREKYISRTFSEISQELELATGPIDPRDFVPRFCQELQLSKTVERKATEVLELTMEEGLHSGKSPSGFAAASVYACSLLCDEPKTQREVADATRTNESTIRTRYQEQIRALDIIDE